MKSMTENEVTLKDQDTYIYIDVSNIRWACQKTLGFRIDFVRLLEYFRQKYPNLKDVRYYEGIAIGDTKKRRMFNFLEYRGYTICALERKTYNSMEIDRQDVEYPKCGTRWTTESVRRRKAMKSNVDVYLATELLAIAHRVSNPTHIILVSCDGDYAEMIKNALENENVSISVLATPPAKTTKKNTLSVRLRALRKDKNALRYQLTNIAGIAELIGRE